VPKLGWPHIAVALTAGAALVVLVVAAAAMSAEQRASLVFETGKTALIVLSGTVLTWILQEVVRNRDLRRDEANRRTTSWRDTPGCGRLLVIVPEAQ
jgi:membrane protein implicated in regulation of membrane protease activity